jgi:hypothetical protein
LLLPLAFLVVLLSTAKNLLSPVLAFLPFSPWICFSTHHLKEPRLQNPTTTPATTAPTQITAETHEEARLIRRLQLMMNLVLQTIAQDHTLTIDDASQMIADARTAALAMFPGKELAYDLIWRPRFQRLMRERFRIM